MSSEGVRQLETIASPGLCPWHCGRLTTHAVEWPPGQVEVVDDDGELRPFDGLFRTYACADDAAKIREYQHSIGIDVVVREAGEGKW